MIVAQALLPFTAVSVTGTDAGTSDIAEPTQEEAAAIQFRATLGFPNDITLVRAAAADPKDYPTDAFGYPLSASETAEILRRMDVQWAMDPGMSYANGEPDFAGAFIDQLAGGVPVFLFTGDLETHRSELVKVMKEPITFRVELAKRSLQEMLALQAEIDDQREDLKASGTSVIETGIRTDLNAVSVGIQGLSATKEAALTARFGDELLYEEAAPAHSDCTNGSNCRPIKGGLAIDSSNGWTCTSGFVVRQSGGGPLRLLTAGHCLDRAGGEGVDWLHHGTKFGDALKDTWQVGYTRTADVGLISILSGEQSQMINDNDMHGGAGRVYPVVGRLDGANQAIGMAACRYGRNGGYDCGFINQLYANRLSCVGLGPSAVCMTVTKTIRVDFDSVGGDSGGPVWQYINLSPGLGAIALGTHVHSANELAGPYQDPQPWYGWYSPIDVGAAQYNSNWGYTYTLCVTQNC